MKRSVLVLQEPGTARDARVAALESAGFAPVAAAPDWTALRAALDAHAFHALVVDCSARPGHARECAKYLAERKATRPLPLFLVDVRPADRERTVAQVSTARITAAEKLVAALAQLPAPAAAAVPPRDPSAAFRKRFDLVDDPWVLVGMGDEFRAALTAALGAAAKFQSTTPRKLRTALVELPSDAPDLSKFFRDWQARLAPDGALWVISPKKDHAKRIGSAHTWDAVQSAALTTDLVDTKIAAFSANLTATRFVIRKEKRR